MKKGIIVVLVLCLSFALFANGTKETAKSSVVATKEGGVAVLGTTSTITSFSTVDMRGTDQFFEVLLYEPLLTVGANGSIECILAESYEADPSTLTYTFHLRKGVKFHDGSDFNAEVAKWNLEYYKERGVYGEAYVGVIDHIDIIDNYTIALRLSTWDAFLPVALARGGGASFMMSKLAFDTYGGDYLAKHPVSTSPFMFDSYVEGESIKLVRFDEYWQGKPYLDGITIEIFSESMVMQAAFESGDIHIFGVPDGDTAKYLINKGYTVEKSSSASMAYVLGFESVKADDPFNDVRVRQAVCYAIDAVDIVKTCFEMNGTAANQLDPEGGTYYSEKVDKYDLNIEKAKQLLAEAGYPNGFKTKLSTMSLWSLPLPSQMIVEQLKKIGITVELNIVERAQFFVLQDGWGSVGGMFLSCFSLPAGGGSQIAANFAQNLGSAFGRTSLIHPDDINAYIDIAKNSGGEESIENIKKAEELIFNDYCLCYSLALTNSLTAVSNNLVDSNYGKDTSSSNTLWKAYFAN